jgi:hypothetical protein
VLCAGTAYEGYPESSGIEGSGGRDESVMSVNFVDGSEERNVKFSLNICIRSNMC